MKFLTYVALILLGGFWIQPEAFAQTEQTLLTKQSPKGTYSDGKNVESELGLRFKSDVGGKITAFRFYKSSKESGAHVGKLYSSSGALLMKMNFMVESASGWQEIQLAQPLDILANTEYVISVNSGNSYYVATNNGFKRPVAHGHLKSVAGVYGSVGSMPSKKYAASNYFRDVKFIGAREAAQPSPTPTPTPAPAPVPAPVPVPNMNIEHLLTIQVPDGSYSDGASANYELGLRFKATAVGFVKGVRFFKSAKEAGSHVGKLYASNGALLAQVNFSSESSSGWQEAVFSKAVAISANTEYVVSVNTGNTYYSASNNGFASDISNGHLKSVAGVYGVLGVMPAGAFASSNYFRDILFIADSSAQPEPTPGNSNPPQNPPTPTPPAPPSQPPSTPIPPALADWPNASNTGVPAGTQLTSYAGPCTITQSGTLIDAKTVNCDLIIRAANVMIKRSKINGTISSGTESKLGYSFTVEDSEINAGNFPGTAVGEVNFVVRRSHVYGGNRSSNCWVNCELTDNYFHGQMTDPTGVYHESGVRMGAHGVIQHNTIICDAPDVPPDGGCSASLTGYGDFAAVEDMLIKNNYFPGTTGGYCAYGGSSKQKAFSNDTNNIRFIDNVFAHGNGSGKCGWWGSITDFDPSAPGNIWQNNTWTDGAKVTP